MALILSIIIPHKITGLNNKALSINIESLLENTTQDFELLIDTEVPRCPYTIWNEYAEIAKGEYLIFSNSDVIMAPGWDINMVKYCDDNTIVVGYLAEAGNIGVAEANILIDFGKTPDVFRKYDFYLWSKAQNVPEVLKERGWYMPCCVKKEWFLSTGGFPTDLPFPNPNDILFWNHCVDVLGTTLLRVDSFAYHFQNLSGR